MTLNITSRWRPETPIDRELVLRELDAIISSHHFRNSKRYPALLRYVVDKTLEGNGADLKERTLGVEVFDRSPDYDTSADPVVRFSAGEIRKRIAQFYHENGNVSRLQIDLPPGSYVPEFKLKPDLQDETSPPNELHEDVSLGPADAESQSTPSVASSEKQLGIMSTPYIRWAAILLVGISAFGVYAVRGVLANMLTDKMWDPLLKSPGSVLIVIGNGPHGVSPAPTEDLANPFLQSHGAYNHVSFCEAVALSRLTNVLTKHAKPYQVKEADLATLQDIRNRSVVFIGAYNNLWTMRLIEPLRFHFVREGALVRIADSQNPENHDWVVDYAKPYSSTPYDYAIIARYIDPTTNGETLILAGIGAYGTEAASESVATPQDIKKLLSTVPRGWESKNLELVVKTAVINGEAGPPTLVSSTTW